jgi:hypothetical protein
MIKMNRLYRSIFLFSLYTSNSFGQNTTDKTVGELLSFFNSLAVYSEDTSAQNTLGQLSCLYNKGVELRDAARYNTSAPLSTGLTNPTSGRDLAGQLSQYTDDPATRQLLESGGVFTDAGITIANSITDRSISAVTLNATSLDLINTISLYTNNAKLNKIATSLNDLHSKMGQAQSNINEIMGSDFIDGETSAVVEGVFGAIFILDALLTEPELTQGQKFTAAYIRKSETEMINIYEQRTSLLELNRFDKKVMAYVKSREEYLNKYDLATAKQRLLLLKFRNYNHKRLPEPTVLEGWWKEIQENYKANGLDFIKNEIQKQLRSNTPNYLRNSEESLEEVWDKLNLYKIQYYYSIGDQVHATELSDKMAENSSYDAKKNAIDKAFESKNYKMASQLYPAFFSHWSKAMKKYSTDEEFWKRNKDVAIVFGNKIILDASTIGKGLTSLCKTGQTALAYGQASAVRSLVEEFTRQKDKKIKKKNQQEDNSSELQREIYLYYTESDYQKQNKNYPEALRLLDSVLTYQKNIFHHDLTIGSILNEYKIDILITQGKFDKALEELTMLQRSYNSNYDVATIKYFQAIAFLNLKKYTPALNTITLLETMNPNEPKYLVLERQIYISMNDKKNQLATEQKIQKLTSN